jgi:transcriptional regulator with XRE-family HTH domain
MALKDDPGVHRWQVSNGLRTERSRAALTQQEVADSLEWSLSKVIRIENGTNTISTTDLRALLNVYGVAGAETVDRFITSARQSRKKPWWHNYRELIRPQFAEMLAYESGASVSRTYSPTIVPALIQTRDYAQALGTASISDPYKRDRLTELLMRRQALVCDGRDLKTEFIVDEAALHRWVGSRAIMSEQLSYLLECGRRPRTIIRVLPYTAGAHPALAGPLVLLQLTYDEEDVVFLEAANSDTISHGDPQMQQKYGGIFAQLESLALSEQESTELLGRIQREYEQHDIAAHRT